jgi:uncharacterized surface protein with fasciclin (FAS1) repeats
MTFLPFLLIVVGTTFARHLHQESILTNLQQHGNYSIMANLLGSANLDDVVDTTSPITVFAPTDDAFSQLPDALLVALQLPSLSPLTKSILQYHIATSNISMANIQPGRNIVVPSMLTGSSLWIVKDQDGNVKVNKEANVVDKDVVAKNSLIQGIDRVLTPSFTVVNLTAPLVITPIQGAFDFAQQLMPSQG